jgi:LacI family transcriptional regulator
MKDVAVSAGVSAQTVSNFINGRHHEMSAETRKRVERAMEELDYHPDVSARSLRSARTRTLGFLVVDEHKAFLADPLTAQILAGVGDVARARSFGILLHSADPADDGADLVALWRERRIDGAFVVLSGAPAVRRAHLERIRATTEHFVIFDEPVDDPAVLSVRAAERDAGRILTEHLIAQGHTRIAFLGARVPWAVIEQRFLGYRDALAVAGIAPLKRFERLEAESYASGAERLTSAVLEADKPPTAIICSSDLLALGAIRAALDAGRAVPGDVAVAGFDDFEFAALVEPTLTTVRIPGYEMGRMAATLLIDRLEGQEPIMRQTVFGVELKVRKSA